MDNKRLIPIMLVVSVLMLGYFWISEKNKPVVPPATAPLVAPVAAVAGVPATNHGEPLATKTITLGSIAPADPAKLQLVVNNQSAGIDLVQLNPREYTDSAKNKEPFTILKAEPTVAKPFSTQRVIINGVEIPGMANWVWPVKSATSTEVRLGIDLANNEGKIGTLTKIIKLDPLTYDLTINHEVTNLTGQPMTVQIDQLGPIDLPNDSLQTDMRAYEGKIVKAGPKPYIPKDNKSVAYAQIVKSTNESLGKFQGDDHLVWVAASDRFFTVIIRPAAGPKTVAVELKLEDGTIYTPQFAGEVTAQVMGERPQPGAESVKITGMRLNGNQITVAPNATIEMPLSIYVGPKKQELLAGDIKATPGTNAYNAALYQYHGIIQFGTGMCAWMTSSALATFILWMLDLTHNYVTLGNYGLAIILLVIVVRLLLHPLTRYSQVNMAVMQKKMAAIQPEVDRVKKKYAKDKAQQQVALMQVYKDKKVNPAGGIMGCLPMLLQMPIWIALYSGLAVDINLRHASFIPGWIVDLSNPDTVLQTQTSFHMPVLGLTHNGLPYMALNVLPLLLAVVFFIQMRIQAKTMPKPADEQQAQTQKISQYMILLFPLFLYNAPSGLNLYIFASTAGGIFDTWLVRRHMRAKGMLPNQQAEATR